MGLRLSYVHLWVQTQIIRFGSKCLYLLSHHTGPNFIFEAELIKFRVA